MSGFKPYPAYKDSGVEWLGEVPKHWEVKAIRYLTVCMDGKRIPLNGEERADCQGQVPYWGANAIMDYVDEALFDEDLVLVGEDGAPFLDPSKPVSFHSQGPVWPNNHIHVLRPNKAKWATFLVHCMNNTDYANFIEGSTRQKLTQSRLMGIPVCWPDNDEKEQIVRFLGHETARIDSLIEEQQRLIDLLKEKRQSVISHAVTKGLDPTVPMKKSGVEWLGLIPDSWTVIRLSQVIRTRKGFAFSASDFSDIGIPVVKASDIKNHSINEPTTFLDQAFLKLTPNAVLKKGNVVLSTVGSTPDVKNSAVGQIGRVPDYLDSALLNQNTVIFEPTDSMLSNNYLFFLLLTNAYRDHLDLNAHGTANQASLSLSDMLDFLIPLPDLDEQQAIATELSTMIDAVKLLERESDNLVRLLTERRSALISAAVTGKIDVRGWLPSAGVPTQELEREAV